MQNDEHEIRELVATWMAATWAGDTEKLLFFLADHLVFMLPGQPPQKRKKTICKAAQATTNQQTQFDGTGEIQEIQVLGDWAFMWTKLSVVVTQPGNATPMTRAGHTLSILKKQNGKWVLARDANMLAPVD